ncbi:MAG: hypothetical protein OEZ06_23320 [Myxococcales bacterium]|nr:hypothetical protein [Myxococcales bacterium]
MRKVTSLTGLLLASLTLGCATLPEHAVDRALYVDLRKAVEISGDTGWVLDRVQMEANAESAMGSVCRVEPLVRDRLEAFIGGQIALRGGPAERIHAERGELDGEVLTLDRTLALLRFANAHVAEDCPFWLEPEPDFEGVQGDAGRAVILLESGGFGALYFEQGDTYLGAGGGGRALFAYGVGRRLTLAAGLEVGGFGGLSDNQEGTRRIDATITAGTPLLLRVTWFSRLLDVELTPVVRFDPGADLLPPGLRATVGGGYAAMRTGSLMPYLVVYAGYEVHPDRDFNIEGHVVMVGTRVGVDIDP